MLLLIPVREEGVYRVEQHFSTLMFHIDDFTFIQQLKRHIIIFIHFEALQLRYNFLKCLKESIWIALLHPHFLAISPRKREIKTKLFLLVCFCAEIDTICHRPSLAGLQKKWELTFSTNFVILFWKGPCWLRLARTSGLNDIGLSWYLRNDVQ